ncbi:hypothetical protein P7H56_06600 [Vagococcus lutrae]|uniref:hypothetical protein n=1 Tax=Vagococcus lutrae TaxID=81947 RepID=UPI0028918BB4|nr:hypothetical protein [Vagococcus lutrae]MDT2801941.1 hypothetical protein [Vagococcus lutrae]MDT2824348.1 hypothetical protein [Vagococcus lutrae]
MTLEMRELKGDDLFTLLGIVGKLDIKDEFIKMFEDNVDATPKVVPMDHKKKEPTKKELELQAKAKAKAEKEAQKRGMEVAANMLQKVLLNIKSIKPEINGLLADLTDKEVAEIQDLNLKDYTALLVDFFKKKELADFFSSIASLLA